LEGILWEIMINWYSKSQNLVESHINCLS
jgi:hypothetical protein